MTVPQRSELWLKRLQEGMAEIFFVYVYLSPVFKETGVELGTGGGWGVGCDFGGVFLTRYA